MQLKKKSAFERCYQPKKLTTTIRLKGQFQIISHFFVFH